MKCFLGILFFLNTSIYCSMYVSAKISFVGLSSSRSPYEISVEQNIVPDRLVKNIKKEPFDVDVQCNKINDKEGSLVFNIKSNDVNVKAIIPLVWGQNTHYEDDNVHVSCLVCPLSNN
jgi:hypothetical protein